MYYVKPSVEGSERCLSGPCHTLQYYESNSEWSLNLESNTTIYFMSGVHILDHVLSFDKVDNLSLVGSIKHSQSATLQVQEPSTKIVCRGRNGFLFGNITSLLIANLSIGNCGREVKDLPYYAYAVDIVCYQSRYLWYWLRTKSLLEHQ